LPPEKKTSVPPEKLKLYEKLVTGTPGIESKSNFGAAYTAVNGNMYSMISKIRRRRHPLTGTGSFCFPGKVRRNDLSR
jgi:hypothetical protein